MNSGSTVTGKRCQALEIDYLSLVSALQVLSKETITVCCGTMYVAT
ncbi:hypothetical protein GQ600_26252 [Phytophthora cactorum]|nr:hypothetical protein GQ600_26252 [Phytophthora cactorum]